MGTIRKQAIYSSIVIYIGFFIGFLNTYFFVRNGNFTTEQYGLTRLMNDIANVFFSFSTLGVVPFIYKFYPYYHDNLPKAKNDQVAISVSILSLGCFVVTMLGVAFAPWFITHFGQNKNQLLGSYYYWIFPIALGLAAFTIFEGFAWFNQKNVVSSFLKETASRLLQTILIVLFVFNCINFDTFIKFFSLCYPIIAITLIGYLYYQKLIVFNFTWSIVTKKFYKKALSLMSLLYGGLIITTLAQYVDSIFIGTLSSNGLKDVGIYTLASFIASTVQVPQRSIIAATIPALSFAWKQKNLQEIDRIYKRSSINLLLLSLMIFGIIWVNVDQLFEALNIQQDFAAGKTVILLAGIARIIDAGTGVNSQIIGTSNYWRFEVFSGIFLLAMLIPLNYFLVKSMGYNGSAISNLISFFIYNAARLWFIWYKFKLQPFTVRSIFAPFIFVIVYFIVHSSMQQIDGIAGLVIRTTAFALLSSIVVLLTNITPDATQLYYLALEKFKRK